MASLSGNRKAQIKKNLKRGSTLGGPGVGKGFSASLGRQLSNRVSTGAVTQRRASQTARERQTLQAAFGSDWRTQVFGKGGAKGVTGPFAKREIAQDRAKALLEAKAKLGNVGPAKGVAGTLRGRTPSIGPLKTKKARLRY
ncbi:MAG TPA: hypothetical protein VFJ76_07665 [Solirubrobacterales bacterium]|nr:hypothetical protein [Solirubrobacterales bacterium]